METEIKSKSIDWHEFRKTLENEEFHYIFELVDTWQDIDAVKIVLMMLCETLERMKEQEK